MSPYPIPTEHPFKTGWPDSLRRAVAGDAAARESFASFALAFYRSRRWRLLRSVPDAHHDDLTQDMALHALERLASYHERPGVPFEAWLLAVGSRVVLDRLRSDMARRRREQAWGDETHTAARTRPDPAVVARARDALAQLGAKCRLLLGLLQDGLRPAEMVEMARAAMGDPTLTNKRVADDLAYCKRLLAKKFAETAVAPMAAPETP